MVNRVCFGVFATTLLLLVWGCKSGAPTGPTVQSQDTSKFAVWDFTRYAPPLGRVHITGRGFTKIGKGLYVTIDTNHIQSEQFRGDSNNVWISLPNISLGTYSLSVTIDSVTVLGPGKILITNLPIIDSIAPISGAPGDPLVVYYQFPLSMAASVTLGSKQLSVIGSGHAPPANEAYVICTVPQSAVSGFIRIFVNGTASVDSLGFVVSTQPKSNFNYSIINVSMSGIIGPTFLDSLGGASQITRTETDTLQFSARDSSAFIRAKTNNLDTAWFDASYWKEYGVGSEQIQVTGFGKLDSVTRRISLLSFSYRYSIGNGGDTWFKHNFYLRAHDLPYTIDASSRLSVSLTGLQFQSLIDSVGFTSQDNIGLSGYHSDSTLKSFSGLTSDAVLKITLSP